jgi:DNA-binding HxlR family transcriptional regulator
VTRSYEQQCPIARTLDLVGDRWTLLIIRDLFLGKSKFKEFLQLSPGMPTRMLSERLKSLEANGLVERRVYSTHPLRAEYRLTAGGRSLAPVVEALVAWGIEHTFEPAERIVVVEKINRLTAGVDRPART